MKAIALTKSTPGTTNITINKCFLFEFLTNSAQVSKAHATVDAAG
jgi:hypothetical protein